MTRNPLGWLGIYCLLAVAVTWAAFPIAFMVSGSFKPPNLIWSYPPTLVALPTTTNYEAISRLFPSFWRHLCNSVVVTLTTTVITMVMALGAAFVFSRLRSGWLRFPAFLMILVRMFPPIIIIIPLFPVFNALGWLDTLTPLVMAGVAFAISIATLLLKTFVDDVPVELEEAAMIDGASRLGAFVRITVPLVMPAVAAIALVVAIGTWNEFLFPLVFTSSAARTAPVTIAIAIDNEDGVAWGAVMAMASAHLAPALVLVLLLHRQLMRVMTGGAVKG
ncbi:MULTISPECIES: carbohydrate ABC transporter permease [unclassified Chelatococcus]|uniref:carbohydrate ABC transporter permease n=1 Tax=unclassified Chelatococcus TaxID=2638111 RepID=UPI001BD147A2|nr:MULTISPECIES: carbohydrate ABC transporter permease [unclassified Chelatococcus]MBS7701612.1 carbohydrate ABC transporter permease [Chelatococcus sp. YT9]MBX3559682.1 carbohydrate ABC transporter permease [Chelatococcus sp.]